MRLIKSWVLATFILCFLVIIAGGVVRTTQSGMGCPDWPKCFGMWIPPTQASELPADFEKYLGKQDIDHSFNAFHTWIEYINRLLGVLLGLFGIIQVVLLFGKRKTAKPAFRLALAFLAAVIVTGLFGAIVVKLNLAHLSISVHLLFAILLLQIQLALLLSLGGRFKLVALQSPQRNILIIFLVLLFVQSILGTMVRIYVDDISKALDYQQRALWLQELPVNFLIHRSFSWVILAGGLFVVWKNRHSQLATQFKMLALVLLMNMTVGIVLYYAGMPAWAQPLHLLLAAIALTQTVGLVLQTRTDR